MRILISPAKKMNTDTDSLPFAALPLFLPEAERLLAHLRSMDDAALQSLWGCNDTLARLNTERVRHMDLTERLTPAILSYEGIQYRYMAPSVFESAQLAYISEHLRILSGFYGLLRPFDGVTPYRLEMQARLPVDGCRDLYAFWGDRLARQLCAETDLIVNLASKEYSRAVAPFLPAGVRLVSCVFGELNGEKIIEKGTMCKMARGEMVRFLAERTITDVAGLLRFDRLGYAFSAQHSAPDRLVFLKAPTR